MKLPFAHAHQTAGIQPGPPIALTILKKTIDACAGKTIGRRQFPSFAGVAHMHQAAAVIVEPHPAAMVALRADAPGRS